MNSNGLVGTWKYGRSEEPDGTGWIQFLVDGRIYSPVHYGLDAQRRCPSWLRGVIESSDTLRVFSRANDKGWTVSFLLEGDTLKLYNKDGGFCLCTRTAIETAPQWFRNDIEKAMA